MSKSTDRDSLTFETAALRNELKRFLDTNWKDPISDSILPIGNFKFGVYAFFDYDLEPIYVGQTKEKLSTRIRRHLTVQQFVERKGFDPHQRFLA